ncbi:MAG: LysR family transcriptional regulator [Nocardia sp.]|nr:LysR family transcriptional regulator [Nocardia sp.]
MELRDIEVFLVLADELHFRRAAQRLYLSTARVSQTVRALEKELGGSLFARTSRQVRLTSLGEQFRADVGRGVEQVNGAVSRACATAERENGLLRLGYVAGVPGAMVTELAAGCEARSPDTHVATLALFTRTGFEPLRQRGIDVLLAWSPGSDAAAVAGAGRVAGPALARVCRAVVVPREHRLAGRSEVGIEEVAEYELLDVTAGAPSEFAAAWMPLCTPRGRRLRRMMPQRAPVSSVADDLALVQRYRLPYLTIGSLLTCHPYPGLVSVPVSDLPSCELVPIWHREFESAAIRSFCENIVPVPGAAMNIGTAGRTGILA